MSAVIRATAWASVCTLVEIIVNLRAPVVTPPVRCSASRLARRTEPINCPRITGPPLVYQSVKTFARQKFHCERTPHANVAHERIVRHRENRNDSIVTAFATLRSSDQRFRINPISIGTQIQGCRYICAFYIAHSQCVLSIIRNNQVCTIQSSRAKFIWAYENYVKNKWEREQSDFLFL